MPRRKYWVTEKGHKRICQRDITFLVARPPFYVIFCHFFCLLPPLKTSKWKFKEEFYVNISTFKSLKKLQNLLIFCLPFISIMLTCWFNSKQRELQENTSVFTIHLFVKTLLPFKEMKLNTIYKINSFEASILDSTYGITSIINNNIS